MALLRIVGSASPLSPTNDLDPLDRGCTAPYPTSPYANCPFPMSGRGLKMGNHALKRQVKPHLMTMFGSVGAWAAMYEPRGCFVCKSLVYKDAAKST